MALVIKDRVKETTTTTGTATYQLAGAVSGFEGFIQVGDGNTTYYVCTDNTDFEIGIGTFTDASPDTLSRDTILQSSNSDNKVDWSAGTRTIFCTYPADKAVFEDASNNINGTFVGNITGNVTGNTSGTAATVTTAAQTNITSLGTLTALTVDDVAIDGKVVTLTGSTSDTATLTAGTNGTLDIVTTDAGGASANIQITADGTAELAGTTVTLDSSGGITLDADGGTITFADAGSSLGTITSSGYSGNSATASAVAAANLTGNTLASGVTASSLTSVGTLSSNLNLGGQDIVTTASNQDIDLAAHGTGKVVIKGNTNQGAIKLNCEANSHGQTIIAAPHSESASNTLTLPSTGGDARLVSATSTATLTNKTLTSPVLNTGVSGTAIKDEDDMTSDSASHLATQQSIKAYVDAQKADMQFVLEDGDGTEVQITKDKEVKFVEGGGLDINWTDVSTGSDGDPYDLTFTINAAQTGITSLLATDIKIGEDDQTKIDFETANTINFYAGNEKQLILTDGALTPGSNAIVDLGTDSLEFKDAFFDGTVEADAITLNGTSITTTATLSTGISNGNVLVATSGIADNDFLKVDGTSIEGRSSSEVLSDIGGQASLTFGISNTNAVKIDSSSVADDEYARFTANGLESRSTSEVLSDIGGQASLTFGISNTNAVKVDSSSVADDEYARFTANGLESRSASETRGDIGLGTAAVLDTGISNTNVPKFTSGVADNDFLRVDGTAIEGRSASEVLSDIGGQASLTFGISNTNAVKIDHASVADDDFARFTSNGLEGRSSSEVLSDIGATTASAAADEATALAIALG